MTHGVVYDVFASLGLGLGAKTGSGAMFDNWVDSWVLGRKGVCQDDGAARWGRPLMFARRHGGSVDEVKGIYQPLVVL